MGWERKRGKLIELNRLLYGRPTSFETTIGDVAAIEPATAAPLSSSSSHSTPLRSYRPQTARRMIGALAHPLKRPQFDRDRVTSGYVLLQPRVGITLGSANRSWYARLFANSPASIHMRRPPRTCIRICLVKAGFTGKGIYDLAAFEHALDGAFPRITFSVTI